MTIDTIDNVFGPTEGNGVTTAFAFNGKVTATADLKVYHLDADGVEILLVQDDHYSIALNLDQDNSPGGTVTYPRVGSGYPVLPANEFITRVIDPEPTQDADLKSADDYNPVVVEDQLDKITILIQKVRRISRHRCFLWKDESSL